SASASTGRFAERHSGWAPPFGDASVLACLPRLPFLKVLLTRCRFWSCMTFRNGDDSDQPHMGQPIAGPSRRVMAAVDIDWASATETMSRIRRKRVSRADSTDYSPRLAALAGFTVRHKGLIIAAWIAVAGVLAVLFPQLETVVRQQSVELIPHDVASFQTV